jgi:predicted nucleotidyltransferase
LKERPRKNSFPSEVQISLREKAINEIKSKLLPDDKIIKIILIGSSVKGSFGEYESSGFRGSMFSDFDFIVFVEDEYVIPEFLEKEPEGRPFPESKLNLAYKIRNLVEGYDGEVFFIRRKTRDDPKIQELEEHAGIPMTRNSKHKKLLVHSRE